MHGSTCVQVIARCCRVEAEYDGGQRLHSSFWSSDPDRSAIGLVAHCCHMHDLAAHDAKRWLGALARVDSRRPYNVRPPPVHLDITTIEPPLLPSHQSSPDKKLLRCQGRVVTV
jgi:hypothetical protein